jgi:hypothetical protein
VCHVPLPLSYRSRRGNIHLPRVLPLVGCRSKTPTLASLLCMMSSSRFPSLLATNGMAPPIVGVFLPRPAVHTPQDLCLAAPSYRSHPSSAPCARPFVCTPMHRTTRSCTRVRATTAFRLRRASPPYLSCLSHAPARLPGRACSPSTHARHAAITRTSTYRLTC